MEVFGFGFQGRINLWEAARYLSLLVAPLSHECVEETAGNKTF